LPMMTYIDGISACPRDGNYFSNIYWITRPPNPWTGEWTGVDGTRAGVFIDLPDKKGYLSFAKQGIGRIGYDYGGYNADGHYQDVWYFYNIKDLGAVALGDKEVTSVLPDTYSTIQYPIPGRITSGACFDEETRMLYVYVMQSIPRQYGSSPIIHVYHLTEESASLTLLDHVFDQHADHCFGAFQNIVVAGDGNKVEFQAGSKLNLIAGHSIRFLPGFHAREGNTTLAWITTNGEFCPPSGGAVFGNSPKVNLQSVMVGDLVSKSETTEMQLKIFPNPNKGKFTIKVLGSEQASRIVIINSSGAIVHKDIVFNEKTIELVNAERGLYLVEIVNGKELMFSKLLIR
jgi:hypothetical protein